LRSLPFCRPMALSCDMPLLAGPPRVRNHQSEGMRLAALCHTKMADEVAALRAAVSSAMESMLGHSPNEIFCEEVVGVLVDEF
jgi:hypothetical protein